MLERHKQESVDYLILRDKAFEALAVQNEKHDSMLEDELWNEFAKEDTRLSDCLDKEYEDWLLSAKIASSLSEEQGKYILKFVMSKTEATDIKQKCVLAKLDEIQELLDGLAENTES